MFDKEMVSKLKPYMVLKNNKSSNVYDFIKEFDRDHISFKMPYSFMMGVFNYLSSLFHASQQMYVNHLLQKCNSTKNKYFKEKFNCIYKCIAHSDDSGAKIIHQCDCANIRALFYHELLLKTANHMLSHKKCVIS